MQAATITVDTSSGTNKAAIQAAYNLASDGDIISIPPGDYYGFTSEITVTKAVQFVGQNTNTVIIHDSIPNATRASTYNGLFYAQVTNQTLPIVFKNLHFKTDSTNTTLAFGGIITAWFRGQGFAIENVWWDHIATRPFYFHMNSSVGDYGGVVSKCLWVATSATSGCFIDSFSENGNYGMTLPVDHSSTNRWFTIEDCIISNQTMKAWIDGRGAMNVCFRFNKGTNFHLDTHEVLAGSRGSRAMAVYGNVIRSTSGQAAVDVRSGTLLCCSNNFISFSQMVNLNHYRALSWRDVGGNTWGMWGGANGTNFWDQYGPTLDTGTVSGILTNSGVGKMELTDTNKSWTVNQWKGYTINNSANRMGGLINGNSATTLFMYANDGVSGTGFWETYFTNGNPYQINQLISGFDMCAQGTTDLLSGGGALTLATPSGWPHPAIDPIYYWNNTNTTVFSVGKYDKLYKAGIHYTNVPMPGFTPFPYPHPLITFLDGLPPVVVPTISSIADQTIAVSSNTGDIAFTIGGGATNVNNYVLTYASTTTSLVPNAATNVVFGGSGVSRTIALYPVTGQSGSTIITVTVTDEVGNTATRSFTLNVSNANSPPTISNVVNQTLALSSTTGPLAFTVGDVETSPGSLTVTAASSDTNCIPLANITLGGSGASRNVTVVSGTVSGFSTITLTVSDGTTNAFSGFVVTVATVFPNKVNTKIANIGRIAYP